MENKQYKYAVVIGRFAPPHHGHFYLIQKAFEHAEEVIVLIGSSYRSRSPKNPFTWSERLQMINNGLSQYEFDHLHARPIPDFLYNNSMWLETVQKEVDKIAGNTKVCLVGHEKDDSSFYLKMFPQWDYVETGEYQGFDATTVREMYFDYDHHNEMYGADAPEYNNNKEAYLPNGVIAYLNDFARRDEYYYVAEEFNFIKEYRQQWSVVPHPVIFVTTDAVVVQGGHVLLVRRKARPGLGLWALPGGFLKYNELIQESMLRELKEETRIKVNKAELRKQIKDWKVFDHPDRSQRGRTITHAALIPLPESHKLPEVRGGDDASHAFWMPLKDIQNYPEMFYEDHKFIIDYFMGEI